MSTVPKMNKKIILFSLVLSSCLLFGGWFMLQYFGAEKPIQNAVDKFENVELEEYSVDQQTLGITLRFEEHPQFATDILQLTHDLKRAHPKKEIRLEVAENQGVNHPWWLQHAAEITEVIHQKEYSKLKPIIEGWEQQGLIEQGNVLMNHEQLFIYVQLVADEDIYIYLTLDDKV
jgi:hypothetical protein